MAALHNTRVVGLGLTDDKLDPALKKLFGNSALAADFATRWIVGQRHPKDDSTGQGSELINDMLLKLGLHDNELVVVMRQAG